MKKLVALVLAAAAFATGFAVRHYRVFPYRQIRGTVRVARRTRDRLLPRDSDLLHIQDVRPIENGPSPAPSRFGFLDGDRMADSVIWLGGYGRFGDLSSEHGCLAVEFSPEGEPRHAIPLRLDEIEQIEPIARMPYWGFDYSIRKHLYFFGLTRHDSGDVFATVHHNRTPLHPYAGGIIRFDPEGYPIWWRRDYSHHAPSLGTHPEFGEVLVVPGMRLHHGEVKYDVGGESTSLMNGLSEPVLLDFINVISPMNGELIRQFPVIDAIRNSPYAGALNVTIDPYDPAHVNSVVICDDRVGGGSGLFRPGDLVVSMRSLSALAIMDGRDGSLKKLVRGSFLLQHAARHWQGSEFLILDNQGTDGTYGPSRLMSVDLETGEERTIFPNAATPDWVGRRSYTRHRGHVSVSADRTRAICSFPNTSFAVEVRLSDGKCLTVFESVDNVAQFEMLRSELDVDTVAFNLNSIEYIK